MEESLPSKPLEDWNLTYTATARAAEEVYTVERRAGLLSNLPEEIDIPFSKMLPMLGGTL